MSISTYSSGSSDISYSRLVTWVIVSFACFMVLAVINSVHNSGSTDPGVIELVLGPWQSKEPSLFPDTSDDESTSLNLSSSSQSSSSSSSSFPSSSSTKYHNGTIVKSRSKRQVPCKVGSELDEYVDSLFRFASRLIRAMEPFSGMVPNATIELPEYNLIIFLHSGGASHAYTISRKKPAWVMCMNESISLGLTVGFEELRIMYKFRVIQDWKLLFDGELEAQINHPKIQAQFTQTTPDEDSEEQVQQRIDALRIWSLGHIRIMLKGLGNLTQAMSMFLTGFLNRNLDQLMPQIRDGEKMAIELANRMLENISIPFFSII